MASLHYFRNLKCFDDVLFIMEDGSRIGANSAILQARCEYFESMLGPDRQFKKESVMKIKGISKEYFDAILNFIYTDRLSFVKPFTLCVWVHFLIYADYFMLGQLVQKASYKIGLHIKLKNVMQLYLISRAHNASLLEQICLNFMAIHYKQLFQGKYPVKSVD
jgi:hypothetical protein